MKGFTEQEQATLQAARDVLASKPATRPVITSWDALNDYVMLNLQNEVEVFHVLYLDRKNRLIEDVHAATGTVDHVPVYVREVIKGALLRDASAIILAHNHPSGDPAPSQGDITMTKDIAKACKVMGITLHDHVIAGAGRVHSMKANGDF